MPAQDGTGPMGKGPRTGRGMGHCKRLRRRRIIEELEDNEA